MFANMVEKSEIKPMTDYFLQNCNSDGMLGRKSYSDFLASSVCLDSLSEKIGQKIFSNFDTNNSGHITPYNFSQCLTRQGQTLSYSK